MNSIESRLLVHRIVFLVFLLILPLMAKGQESSGTIIAVDPESEKQEPAILQGIGRWSLKFNAVDFLCTVPNLGVEFDLGNNRYSQKSLSLTARYNWDETSKGYLPANVFNVFELRPEYRQYKRGLNRSKRVFYWGAYASGGTYSVKFSESGHQGLMLGAGASLGYVTPLHEFKRLAIDMEIGGSLGFCVRNADGYRLSEDRRSYLALPEESFGLRIVPWPVVSEIRVAFVFRKVSAWNRYHLTKDQTKALRAKKEESSDRK